MELTPEAYLQHFGVKGMKWGVRRDPNTGVRPIAKTLNDSRLGDASRRNVERHYNRKAYKKARGDKMHPAVRIGGITVGALLMAHGARTIYSLRKEYGPLVGNRIAMR